MKNYLLGFMLLTSMSSWAGLTYYSNEVGCLMSEQQFNKETNLSITDGSEAFEARAYLTFKKNFLGLSVKNETLGTCLAKDIKINELSGITYVQASCTGDGADGNVGYKIRGTISLQYKASQPVSVKVKAQFEDDNVWRNYSKINCNDLKLE